MHGICVTLALLILVYPIETVADNQAALFDFQGNRALTRSTEPQSLPYWVTHIPENGFVGISSPSRSVGEARRQAMESAISQILQAMGADYQLTHESVLSGNLEQSSHELRERLKYATRWLLDSVQQNARQSAFHETADGVIGYVLVQMMPWELDRLKRLSIGAKLTARIIETGRNHVCIELKELNGVGVTLTHFRITVSEAHKNAKLITLFFWKVPDSDTMTYEGSLPRSLLLKNSTDKALIGIHNERTGLSTVLMGTERNVYTEIFGYDEIGRAVSVPAGSP